jgi:hypothetical protein
MRTPAAVDVAAAVFWSRKRMRCKGLMEKRARVRALLFPDANRANG